MVHAELGQLSTHLAPETLVPIGGFALRCKTGLGEMARPWASDINLPDEAWLKALPDVARWGDLPAKGPMEVRLRIHKIGVSLHNSPPKAPPPSFVASEEGVAITDDSASASALLTARLQLLELDLNAGDDTLKVPVPTVLAASLHALHVVLLNVSDHSPGRQGKQSSPPASL